MELGPEHHEVREQHQHAEYPEAPQNTTSTHSTTSKVIKKFIHDPFQKISSGIIDGSKKGINFLADHIGGIDHYIEKYVSVGADEQTRRMVALYRDSFIRAENQNPQDMALVVFLKDKSELFKNITALCNLSHELNSKIAALKKQESEKHYLSGEDKEKLERFELLRIELDTNPIFIAEKIHQHGDHPVYKHMEPVKFLSILVKSNKNLALAHPQTLLGIPEVERIALYGYTTEDYVYLNEAARQSNGFIQNPGIRSYFEHVVLAFYQLPTVTLPILNKQGLPVDLKRGIATIPSQKWVDETFVVGKTYIDYAFSSCTNDYAVQMMGTLTFKAPQGATEFPYARILAEPYTAQRGEAEILLAPGASFIISHVEKLPGGAFKVELQPG